MSVFTAIILIYRICLTLPWQTAHQKKDGHKFFVDNSGETTPLDWYHARFNVDFKLVLLADGGDITADDHNGMVNSAHSFIKKLIVKMNGNDVYTCSEANHATNIKNLLEYSQGYAKSQGTNEFFYIDTKRHAEERRAQAAYNSGFAARKALLGTSSKVNVEIPLNRYGFFQSLYLRLLPTSKIELEINLESDANLVWQAGANCRVVLTKFQLIIPRIVFNAEGKATYMSEYLNIEKPIKWNYLSRYRDVFAFSDNQLGRKGFSHRQQPFTFILILPLLCTKF